MHPSSKVNRQKPHPLPQEKEVGVSHPQVTGGFLFGFPLKLTKKGAGFPDELAGAILWVDEIQKSHHFESMVETIACIYRKIES